MPAAVILSHRAVAHETGHIGSWLESNDYEVIHVYREDPDVGLKSVEGDVLFALGSPNSVATGFCLEPARSEIDLVSDWVSSGRAYVGVCFGAQVLACALGGSVHRMDVTYRAYGEMVLSNEAPDACAGSWAVWHEDAIRAPSQAQVLARLPHADTIFRVGNAWGIQPHIEFTSGIVQRLAEAFEVGSADVIKLHDDLRRNEVDHARRTHDLLTHILESA